MFDSQSYLSKTLQQFSFQMRKIGIGFGEGEGGVCCGPHKKVFYNKYNKIHKLWFLIKKWDYDSYYGNFNKMLITFV